MKLPIKFYNRTFLSLGACITLLYSAIAAPAFGKERTMISQVFFPSTNGRCPRAEENTFRSAYLTDRNGGRGYVTGVTRKFFRMHSSGSCFLTRRETLNLEFVLEQSNRIRRIPLSNSTAASYEPTPVSISPNGRYAILKVVTGYVGGDGGGELLIVDIVEGKEIPSENLCAQIYEDIEFMGVTPQGEVIARCFGYGTPVQERPLEAFSLNSYSVRRLRRLPQRNNYGTREGEMTILNTQVFE